VGVSCGGGGVFRAARTGGGVEGVAVMDAWDKLKAGLMLAMMLQVIAIMLIVISIIMRTRGL